MARWTVSGLHPLREEGRATSHENSIGQSTYGLLSYAHIHLSFDGTNNRRKQARLCLGTLEIAALLRIQLNRKPLVVVLINEFAKHRLIVHSQIRTLHRKETTCAAFVINIIVNIVIMIAIVITITILTLSTTICLGLRKDLGVVAAHCQRVPVMVLLLIGVG